MNGLKKNIEQEGYNFTVAHIDSIRMEKASGRICYTEDTGGALTELVETHKMSVVKKLD